MREKLNKDMSFMNKGFTFRSGPVKKKVNSYSSFWDSSTDNYNVDEFLGNDVDTPKGKDPDSYSPTLRKYHKILWSKNLSNGTFFKLNIIFSVLYYGK